MDLDFKEIDVDQPERMLEGQEEEEVKEEEFSLGKCIELATRLANESDPNSVIEIIDILHELLGKDTSKIPEVLDDSMVIMQMNIFIIEYHETATNNVIDMLEVFLDNDNYTDDDFLLRVNESSLPAACASGLSNPKPFISAIRIVNLINKIIKLRKGIATKYLINTGCITKILDILSHYCTDAIPHMSTPSGYELPFIDLGSIDISPDFDELCCACIDTIGSFMSVMESVDSVLATPSAEYIVAFTVAKDCYQSAALKAITDSFDYNSINYIRAFKDMPHIIEQLLTKIYEGENSFDIWPVIYDILDQLVVQFQEARFAPLLLEKLASGDEVDQYWAMCCVGIIADSCLMSKASIPLLGELLESGLVECIRSILAEGGVRAKFQACEATASILETQFGQPFYESFPDVAVAMAETIDGTDETNLPVVVGSVLKVLRKEQMEDNDLFAKHRNEILETIGDFIESKIDSGSLSLQQHILPLYNLLSEEPDED